MALLSRFQVAYHNFKEALPSIMRKVADRTMNPEEEITQNVFLLSRNVGCKIYSFMANRTGKETKYKIKSVQNQ